MISISVVIITLNEERNLARCLSSVKDVADEIVVVDTSSTDRTVEIAKEHGAIVIDQSFLGYTEQKNFAAGRASNNWILSLDADEALSPELKNEILAVKQKPVYNAYLFPRLTNYCGSWIRHCGWYPDKKTRLFDRTKGEWKGGRIHEHWELHDAGQNVGALKGDLLHYSYYTITDHIKQIEKFTALTALAALEKGKSAGIVKVWFAPKWRFFTDYVLKLGFLDGYAGYLVCKYSAYATFIKYTRMREIQKLKNAS